MDLEAMHSVLAKVVGQPASASMDLIRAQLDADPVFQVLEQNAYIRIGTGRSSTDTIQVAAWIFAQAQSEDLDGLLERVDQVLRTNRANAFAAAALEGIDCDQTIDLTEELQLIPGGQVPQRVGEDMISVQRPKNLPPLPVGPRELHHTAALIWRYEEHPVYTASEEPLSDVVKLTDLYDVASCLTALGGVAPLPLAGWHDFEDPVPGMTGSMTVVHDPEIDLPRKFEPGPFDPENAQTIVQQYLRLDESSKDKLRIPLQRLNLALRRRQMEDRAIELGIALESLLLADSGSNIDLTLRIGLRGALLLGGDITVRRRHDRLLKNVYWVRSKAVHGGKVPQECKGQRVEQILSDGLDLCAALLRTMISRGVPSESQWTDLQLGA
jgi:hypothetical protein